MKDGAPNKMSRPSYFERKRRSRAPNFPSNPKNLIARLIRESSSGVPATLTITSFIMHYSDDKPSRMDDEDAIEFQDFGEVSAIFKK